MQCIQLVATMLAAKLFHTDYYKIFELITQTGSVSPSQYSIYTIEDCSRPLFLNTHDAYIPHFVLQAEVCTTRDPETVIVLTCCIIIQFMYIILCLKQFPICYKYLLTMVKKYCKQRSTERIDNVY